LIHTVFAHFEAVCSHLRGSIYNYPIFNVSSRSVGEILTPEPPEYENF